LAGPGAPRPAVSLLEVQGLVRRFGALAAVNDVSFEVAEGEVFGIAGPNGAGKSVLFSTISGFYKPTSGEVRFDGRPISGMPPHRICHLGLTRTFQTPTLFHSLTVQDNIRVGAEFGRGGSGVDVPAIIDLLDLGPVAGSRATNLDLFTTKKVVLGAALATHPRMLLLDEPMAGFSHVEIEQYLELVAEIRRRWGTTVIIIEHLLDVLIGVSDRMLILHYGSVLFQGRPEDVRDHKEVVDVYLGGGIEA
jgi:branched-chain amino acid transport system ATP-binding protein